MSDYERRNEVLGVIVDALEIQGYQFEVLGTACCELTVDGKIVRVDIVVPTKPWTEVQS